MRTVTFVFVVVMFLMACNTTSRQTGRIADGKTRLRVENQNLLDMSIFVLRESQRIRLGTVTSLSTRVFVIPEEFVAGATPLQFLADPIGSRQTPVSREITVTPGEEVELLIPNY